LNRELQECLECDFHRGRFQSTPRKKTILHNNDEVHKSIMKVVFFFAILLVLLGSFSVQGDKNVDQQHQDELQLTVVGRSYLKGNDQETVTDDEDLNSKKEN